MSRSKQWPTEKLATSLGSPATSTEFVSALLEVAPKPLRIRIGGYPACGKTTLSQMLADGGKRGLHIQSEAWILSLAERRTRDLSGANPEGYHIARAVADLRAMIGGNAVYLSSYSHKLGRHDGGQPCRIPPSGNLVLDGTPFTLSEFDAFSELCLFLVPVMFEDWLTSAIERDVQTRFFTRAEATRHNMRKARDLELVWSKSPAAVSVKCHLTSSEFLYEVTS